MQQTIPHYFTIAPSPFHLWLAGELSTLHTRRGARLNVLAPRGAGKSNWATIAYSLYCALNGLEKYIILTSDTNAQAKKYLSSVRDELENGERIAQMYPHIAGRTRSWKSDGILLKNGTLIEALGTNSKIRGRRNFEHRPNLIICDDPQNIDHMISQVRRERSWEWLARDVCNAGDPQTNIIVLGTPFHRDCIVCKLQHTPGWVSKVWKSIVVWPKRMDLWREWSMILYDWDDDMREQKARAFYEANRSLMHE